MNDTEKKELENERDTGEGTMVESETTVDLDFEEAIQSKVEEAIKPLRASIEDITNKYEELLEESKKRKTVIRVNKPREETKQERLEREAEEMYQRVKKWVI